MTELTVTNTAGGTQVPPGRGLFAIGVVSLLALVEGSTGGLSAPAFGMIAAALMLVFGLPHGALDIATLRRAGLAGHKAVGLAVVAYLAAAGAMLMLWVASPAAALIVFLAIGVVHFAEDWQDRLPSFFAIGTAVALIASPTIFHGEALGLLFTELDGRWLTGPLVSALTLVAPIALVVAIVGVVIAVQDGAHDDALTTAACLLAMVVLPPLAGFVLFFCAVHSPTNYARAMAALGPSGATAARRDTLWLTLGGLGIATLVAVLFAAPQVEPRWLQAGFVTLSILTVPHMLSGLLAGHLEARAGGR